MYSYSDFKYKNQDVCDMFEVPYSEAYKVTLCGKEIPVYTCRISSYPFNRWWPGYQRPVDQTELVSYVNLVSDEDIELTVEPTAKKEYNRIMIKPYSKGVKHEVCDGAIKFTLCENGAYVLELDDYHGLLYIFNNKPVHCEAPENVTYYFGAGVHFPGKITLNSNESVYVDKDALVYGCISANGADNIKVYGNGIMDDSFEERHSQHCYVPYVNGHVKLYDCKNVKLQGVGFTNSAIWCVNVFHCFDVEIDGINVFGQWRYNTDGIDMMNSRRVTIKNSFVHSFDDTIVIKGIDKYSFEPCTDILTENCVLWCDWGKTCEIGLETAAPEYDNIVFRNCDVIRGGNTVCDIQNGDWAYVHNVLFENINVEFESFHTPAILQDDNMIEYPKTDTIEIPCILMISNRRFREAYSFIGFEYVDPKINQEWKFAGVNDITVRNIHIYADEKTISKFGKECIKVKIINIIPTTIYDNINVENVHLNGERITVADWDLTEIYTEGLQDGSLILK